MNTRLVWITLVLTVLLPLLLVPTVEAMLRGGAKIMPQRRITRQTGRYGAVGGAGSGGYANYQPGGQLGAYSVRGPGAGGNAVAGPQYGAGSSNIGSGQQPVFKHAAARPVGVGGYSFGGVASGRPAYGPNFAVNSGGGGGGGSVAAAGGGGRPSIAYSGGGPGRPQQNAIYRPVAVAGGGRPVGGGAYQG